MKSANKLFSVYGGILGGMQLVASSSATTATTPLAIAVPTGTASGDRLIYFAHSRNANFAVAGPEGGGWVQLCAYDVGTDEEVVAWTRLAAAESGTLDLAFTSTGTTGVCGSLVTVRGAGAVLANIADGNTPADSIGESGALVLGYFGSAFAAGESYSAAPSGMTTLESEQAGSNDTRMLLCSKTAEASGLLETGAPTSTITASNFALHLVVYPAASVSSIWAVGSDSHVGIVGNRTETLARLASLKDRVNLSPASLLVMNGDTLDLGTDVTPAQDIIDAAAHFAGITAAKRFAIGNHDNGSGDSVTDTTPADLDAFYDAMGDATLTQDERERGYYSWTANGVTHLVLNAVAIQAPSEGDYGYGATQKTWVQDYLDNLADGARLVVYSHVDPITTTPDYLRVVSADRTWIKRELLRWATINKSGKILACFTAHEHGLNNSSLSRVTRNSGVDYVNKVDGHLIDGTGNIKASTATNGALDWHAIRWDESAGKLIVVGWGWSGNHVLTPATVAANSLLTNLGGYYPLEDAASATTEDVHGSNELTKYGTITTTNGYYRQGVNKSVTGNYRGTRAITSASTAFSAAGWVKIAARGIGGDHSVILAQYTTTGNQRGFAMEVGYVATVDSFRVILSADGTTVPKDYRGTANLDDGLWHHVGFTFNAGTLKLYVDGVELTGGAINKVADSACASIFPSTGELEIGSIVGGTTWLSACELDEVAWWSRVLTGAEFAILAAGMPYEGMD